jgi:hypothetical protein
MIHLVHTLMHYFPSLDYPADYSVEPEIYRLWKLYYSYKEIPATAAFMY